LYIKITFKRNWWSVLKTLLLWLVYWVNIFIQYSKGLLKTATKKLLAICARCLGRLRRLCFPESQSQNAQELDVKYSRRERNVEFEKAKVIEYPRGYQPKEEGGVVRMGEIPTGHFPALRTKLREALNDIYLGTEATANELIRTAALEKELMDDMLRKAQQDLHSSSEYFKKKLGE
jgi:hypothetical protein